MESSLQTENLLTINRTAENILFSTFQSMESSWSRTEEPSTFISNGNVNIVFLCFVQEQNSTKIEQQTVFCFPRQIFPFIFSLFDRTPQY